MAQLRVTRSTHRSAPRVGTSERNAFTQYYGSDELDASLLQMAPVGFLPPDDPRIVGTVEAIQRSSWSTVSCCGTGPRPSITTTATGDRPSSMVSHRARGPS